MLRTCLLAVVLAACSLGYPARVHAMERAATDQLLASETGTALVRAMMHETIAAAAADGIAISRDFAEQQITATRGMGITWLSGQVMRWRRVGNARRQPVLRVV